MSRRLQLTGAPNKKARRLSGSLQINAAILNQLIDADGAASLSY